MPTLTKHQTRFTDPLGNKILLDEDFHNDYNLKEREVKQIIETPAFLIQIGIDQLFYFRLLGWEKNFLLQADFKDGKYKAGNILEGPSVEKISSLLKEGRLISFL